MSNSSSEEQLRKERNEIWSRCALSAKNNTKPAYTICLEWSQAADALLSKAFKECFPQKDFALFALGKLGSSELNLSSDVDILIVSREESSGSLSYLRKFQKLLGERTSHGYVFRLDFDLRPGGKQGPLIPTIDQFTDFYGNYGETWERLALVRLRPISGDATVQNEVIAFAHKFSFRKHLDFTLLEDLKNLRSKIQNHYARLDENTIVDLKLGTGGIRDVELFTHALQVIHGGKDKSLQTHSTTEALNILKSKELLPVTEADFLLSHYWKLRRIENYVQALNDEQTHLLDLQETHPDFIQADTAHLKMDMQNCDQIVQGLLGKALEAPPLQEELKNIGLEQSDLQEIWSEIIDSQVLSRNKARDEIARKAFLSEFIQTIQQQQGDLRKGLLLLRDFIKGTRAKASFFALLLREKALSQELAWLFGHSPYLSRILCNRPELLDSFVYRAQDKLSEDLGQLLEELAEKRLLSEIINGSSFLEDKNLPELLKNLSSTADSIVISLLTALRKEYSSQIKVLALGKWGGRELGFRSDLDFIFVTDAEPAENDFKFARRFISRLTEAHRGGQIYSIDMRLRPSGKAGPLVIKNSDLLQYLQNEAQPWERQAYLKARWIEDSTIDISSAFISRGFTKAELEELEEIRKQLLKTDSEINLKYSEGGLVDLELAAQTFVLKHKLQPENGSTECFLSLCGEKAPFLANNYARLRQIEQLLQLVASESLSELRPNHESFHALAIALQTQASNLISEVQGLLVSNIAILKELDPRRRSH